MKSDLRMVEVFKTNVNDPGHAERLIRQIHAKLDGCEANFDLDDCDRILRVEMNTGVIEPFSIIQVLTNNGYNAEVLEENVPM